MPLVLALVLLLIAATPAAAKPAACKHRTIVNVLKDSGESVNAGLEQVLCGDVTNDGTSDAVFTIDSGGTAGPTQFGVVDGDTKSLLVIQDGYKLTVDIVSGKRFDVQQPIYKKDDANCCPSAFSFTKYVWVGQNFDRRKGKRYKSFDERFASQ